MLAKNKVKKSTNNINLVAEKNSYYNFNKLYIEVF